MAFYLLLLFLNFFWWKSSNIFKLERCLLKAKGSQNTQVQISVRLAHLVQMEDRAGKSRLGLSNFLCKAQQNKKEGYGAEGRAWTSGFSSDSCAWSCLQWWPHLRSLCRLHEFLMWNGAQWVMQDAEPAELKILALWNKCSPKVIYLEMWTGLQP